MNRGIVGSKNALVGPAWSEGLPAALILLLAALLPYLPSLGAGFAFDDGGLLRDNPAVWSPDPRMAWSTPYWPDHPGSGLYRPWITFSYWWNGKLTGRGPAGFHAVNLVLHASVVLVLWRLLRRLHRGRGVAAFVTTLVFAVHPLHSEAVVAIVGRAELWAALWALLAYRTALASVARSQLRSLPGHTGGARAQLATLLGSGACFALAGLSKESAAGLLALPFAHAILGLEPPPADAPANRRWRSWRPVLAVWLLALLAVLAARRAVLGSLFGLDRPSLSDNVLAHVPAPVRFLAALGFQWILGLRTLFPWELAADYSYPQLAPGPIWMGAGAALLLLLAVLAIRAWRRRDPELLWGGAFLLAAGAVAANVVLPVGTVLAERLAYLPSAATLWLLVVAGGRLHRRLAGNTPSRRVLVPLVCVLWIVFLSARTTARNQDWKGDLRLFQATVEASPRSAKAWSNLAVAQSEQDRIDEALRSSERALELFPEYPAALEIRATALIRSGRPAEAVPLLRSLTETRPRSRSLVELGNAYLTLSRGAAAESAFAAAARIARPDDYHPAIGLASAYALQERWAASEAEWRRAVRLAPGNPDVRRSWAFALWRSGSPDLAEAIYRELLEATPGDASTLNDYAWFLLEADRADPGADGRDLRALDLARRAFTALPDEHTADTLLEALRRTRGCSAARAWIDSLASAGTRTGITAALRDRLRDRCKDAPEPVR